MNICVIGLGKIGLPIAVSYAKKGNSVIGLDTNLKQVDLITPFESKLSTKFHRVLTLALFSFTTATQE